MRPFGNRSRDVILLLFRPMRPKNVRHQKHGLGPAAEFAGELVGGVGEALRHGQAVWMAGRQRVVEMMEVIIAQFDSANADLRVHVYERRGEIERAFQRLPFVRACAPRRIVWLRIRFAAGNGWKHDRHVE